MQSRMTWGVLIGVLMVVTTAAGQPSQPQERPGLEVEIEKTLLETQNPDRAAAHAATVRLWSYGPAAVPALTRGLWSDSLSRRRQCVKLLTMLGADARSAAPSLTRLLRDENNAELRCDAARALASLEAYSAIPALQKALQDDAARVRLAAAESLIELGVAAEVVLPVLTQALKSPRPEEQQQAAWLIGQLGPEATAALLDFHRALGESESFTTLRLIEALGRIGPAAKELVPLIKDKLKNNPSIALLRTPTAIALWRIDRDPLAFTLLREAVDANRPLLPPPHPVLLRINPTPQTREQIAALLKSDRRSEVLFAAELLGHSAPDTVPRLVAILKDRKALLEDHLRAAVILGRIGPEAHAALGPLAQLRNAHGQLPLPVAVAMYQIDPKPEHARAILEYFETRDERVAAAEAIRQLLPPGQAVTVELLLALDSPDEAFRLPCAVALWRLNKDKAALAAVVKTLHSADARLRAQAALELGVEFGAAAKTAVAELVQRLFDSRADVRLVVAEALGRIGSAAQEAVPALLTVLEGDEPASVQSAACEALGLIKPAETEPVVTLLKRQLEHPAPMVRIHAALALYRLAGDETGLPVAQRGLTHRHYRVRITAAELLWQTNRDARVIPFLIRSLEEANLSGAESENERYMIVRALGRIGPPAQAAVPAIATLIQARDPDLAAAARTAFRLIDPDQARKAGVK
ncbi:MAG: HEAT repeat domain-containing protein [Gemmataceae bacterium]|nr:HEAT repeat domain-containing protein [Gemmata sp.]MDW8197903.1 HEAT repeat domain-containing protein [Gemmataceae bacterium]